jgi:hypothetical protein
MEQPRVDGRRKVLLVSGGIFEGPPDFREGYVRRIVSPAPPTA